MPEIFTISVRAVLAVVGRAVSDIWTGEIRIRRYLGQGESFGDRDLPSGEFLHIGEDGLVGYGVLVPDKILLT